MKKNEAGLQKDLQMKLVDLPIWGVFEAKAGFQCNVCI